MLQNQNTAEIVNDLVEINNDRIAGYRRAAEETKDEDADLRSLFNQMVTQSDLYKQELSKIVLQLGEQPTQGTRTDGKIYRAWMDVKATFSGNSRKSVLENCEFGEDAVQKAYDSALSSEEGLSSDVRAILLRQQQSLKASHNTIKGLRDHSK